MLRFFNFAASLLRDRRGVTALEYGLIAAAVVAVGLVGFGTLEGSLSNEFVKVSNTLDAPPAAAVGE